ncbi:hypothetical protein [Streptomyces chrestomyceticus]|uniref:hypothetical protein n=1 Tax=Streptomyces chrestomyceticus TaxID=68185 RepID=UPI003791276A
MALGKANFYNVTQTDMSVTLNKQDSVQAINKSEGNPGYKATYYAYSRKLANTPEKGTFCHKNTIEIKFSGSDTVHTYEGVDGTEEEVGDGDVLVYLFPKHIAVFTVGSKTKSRVYAEKQSPVAS